MKKIYIVSPTSSITGRTRLYKLAQILTENNYEICHYGWKRADTDILIESKKLNIIESSYILKGGGYGGIKNKLYYLLWIPAVFFRLLFLKKSTIWVLGLETAFPAVLASMFRGHDIVFDDADRMVQLFNFNLPVRLILELLERFTSKKSKSHIIPSKERYNYFTSKMLEVKNLPTRNNVSKANGLSIDISILERINKKVVVYANGWLGETRGANFIGQLLDEIDKDNLDIILLIAGRVDSEQLKARLNNKNIIYLEELKYEDALKYYRVSDYILTLYDPKIEINRYAESNKWGDALAFHVTPVINRDVITAKFLKEIAIFVDYDNCNSFVNYLKAHPLKNKSSQEFEDIIKTLIPFESGILKALL